MRFLFILSVLGLFCLIESTCNSNNNKSTDTSKVTSADEVAVDSLEAIIAQGKALFKTNCTKCHDISLRQKLVGPALHGVTGRWGDYPREDLYAWIRDSQALVKKGHPRAVGMFNAWKKNMDGFPDLTDEEIESILVFIENS